MVQKIIQITTLVLMMVICQSCATKATIAYYESQAKLAELKIKAITEIMAKGRTEEKLVSVQLTEDGKVKQIDVGHPKNPNAPSDIAVISSVNIKKKPMSEGTKIAIKAMDFLKVPVGILAGGWAMKQVLSSDKNGDTVNSYNSSGQDMSTSYTGDTKTLTDSYNNVTENTDNVDSGNTSTTSNTTDITNTSDDDSTSTTDSNNTTHENSANTNNSTHDSNNAPETNNNYDYSNNSVDSSTTSDTDTTSTTYLPDTTSPTEEVQ